MALAFPPEVNVLVRDWLSANHVLLTGDDGAVLVDTGYVRHAPFTLALLRSDRALGSRAARENRQHALPQRPHGGQRGDRPRVRLSDRRAGRRGAADRGLGRAVAAARLCRPVGGTLQRRRNLRAGETYRWGNLDWEAIAAPGHDMGALCFFNAKHGLLISGDALWANGFGFVMPPQIEPQALPATRATLETLARLPIRDRDPRSRRSVRRRRRGAGASVPAPRVVRVGPGPPRLARAQGRAHVQAARLPASAARRHGRLRRSRRAVSRLQRAISRHGARQRWRTCS